MTGQITKIISNQYTVNSEGKIFLCNSRGKFRKDGITPMVGDYVEFDEVNNYILDIKPRKNPLIRHMISNIDQGLIITSVKIPDFSTNLLDKLIVLMEINNVTPVICITKMDLLEEQEKKEIEEYVEYYKSILYLVVYNSELDNIKKIFKDKVTVFTGQTGAGKSRLINKLNPDLDFLEGEVSVALGRGRHTTRHIELVEMYDGKVLDTPGFSALEFNNISKEVIRDSFIEFRKYPCKYKDCMHLDEDECNVKVAVEEGKILRSRYLNYQKIVSSR